MTNYTLDTPPLPAPAQLAEPDIERGKRVGQWLNDYMEWAGNRATMTEKLFLEAGGLWLLGVTTARRARVRLDFGDVHNNLYVMWVAGTTYWRKSTGLSAIAQLARATFPHLMLAAQSTPEMLMTRLAGKVPVNYGDLSFKDQLNERRAQAFAAQRGMISDEASKLFGKKYMEGLPELFMEMYDCPAEVAQEFKTTGKLIARDIGLSLLFATTPSRLSSVFGDGEWEDGLLPRFALLTPGSDSVKRIHATRFNSRHLPDEALQTALSDLYNSLGEPTYEPDPADDPDTPPQTAGKLPILPAWDVDIDDEALNRFNTYADAMHDYTRPGTLDNRLTGVYGRLAVQALKVSLSLSLIDSVTTGANNLVISGAHWCRAQSIVEQWRSSAHRLLSTLNNSSDHRNESQIMAYLQSRTATVPPTKHELWKGSRIPSRQHAYSAIEALREDGQICKLELNGREGYIMPSQLRSIREDTWGTEEYFARRQKNGGDD